MSIFKIIWPFLKIKKFTRSMFSLIFGGNERGTLPTTKKKSFVEIQIPPPTTSKNFICISSNLKSVLLRKKRF